jgi:alkylation response protein AidB-like acyl-CoA dehydrogenase
LNFGNNDGCIGYLCGEAGKGLAHMFQMMNAARINTGVSGMTLASTAYQNALEYAKGRRRCTPHAAVDESHDRRHALDDIYRGILAGLRSGIA